MVEKEFGNISTFLLIAEYINDHHNCILLLIVKCELKHIKLESFKFYNNF